MRLVKNGKKMVLAKCYDRRISTILVENCKSETELNGPGGSCVTRVTIK